MDVVLALVCGTVAKVYDDIIDTPIEVSELVKESLKGLQWTTLSLLSVNNFNLSMFAYIIILLGNLGDPSSYIYPYERSLLYIFPIVFLFNSNSIKYLRLADIVYCIIVILALSYDLTFKKDNISEEKCIGRFLIAIGCLLIFLVKDWIGLSHSFVLLNMAFFGYLLTSAIFQGYILYNKS